MRILLKNNGGYAGMEFVQFPVEVEGEDNGKGCFGVSCEEIVRVGADNHFFDSEQLWHFLIGNHAEAVK